MMRTWLLLGVASCLASLHCAPAPRPAAATGPARDTIAFVGATVLPLDTIATLQDQTVIVTGDRITQIGPRTTVAIPAAARIVDSRGRYLMPGLIDAHVHLAHEIELSTLLAFGITTVRNMWGAPIHLAWRERIARGELRGPSIVTAGPILDGEHPAHPGSLIVRSEADADLAIALYRRLGYDFVKIYSRLTPEVFDRLLVDARRDGLTVAGHVPWAVSLDHAVAMGMRSIEHLTGFIAALQAADSPLAGHTDGASRAHQIDHVDESQLASLAQRLAAQHVFDVPTRGVMDAWGDAAAVRDRLARPEMRWLSPAERVLAEPGPDDAEALERTRRVIALYDRVLRALDAAGAPIATGTDMQNPLVIPGVALHRELELLVGAGLSPLAALQAATRRGAELLGTPELLGHIAVGARADLLLLDGNPLDDIHNTRRIAGVMARGSYAGRGELDAMLAQVAAELAGPQDAFRAVPAPQLDGELQFRGDYDITWREIPFGNERITAAERGDALAIALESYDAHQGETTRTRWRSDGSLTLDADGAVGRGHLEVAREGAQLHAQGTSLPGIAVSLSHAIAADAVIVPEGVIASVVLLRSRYQPLAIGELAEVHEQELGLGSELDWSEQTVQVRRSADRAWDDHTTARVYEIGPAHGRPVELVVDAAGWPLEVTSNDHGATLRLRRRPAR